MGHDVFISHSSKDKAAANAVCAALEASGMRCWIAPRNIDAGRDWTEEVMDGIEAAKVMVLIFSRHSNGSDQVKREVSCAIDAGLTVVPLRLENEPMNKSLKYFLANTHWMDALTLPLEKHLQEFTQKVRALLGGDGRRVAPDPSEGREPKASAVIEPAAAIEPAANVRHLTTQAAAAAGTDRLARESRAPVAPSTAPALPRGSTPAAVSPIRAAVAMPPAPRPPADISGAKSFTNTLGMKFVRIEPGEFLMGSRRVLLTKAFMMARTVVTQSQWQALMGSNPSHFQGDDLPVESVSWHDAVNFCMKLSEKEGMQYRLPTEAEWEYACRAGTTTAYYTGDGEAALKEAGWYAGNSESRTHPVGQKKPNAWGLYDMHGNVSEWCSDFFGPGPAGGAVDPTGPAVGDNLSSRVLRGGLWRGGAADCRAACRISYWPKYRGYEAGFRVCLD